jgi:hypothetical protein
VPGHGRAGLVSDVAEQHLLPADGAEPYPGEEGVGLDAVPASE